MADYYESSRSNYFKVKDPEKLKLLARRYQATLDKDDEDPSKFCLLWGDYGFQEYPVDPETGEDDAGDFFSDIAEILDEKSVCVVMGAGAEKLRYVMGWATAVDCTGETVSINIDEIYKRAEDTFPGKEVTDAEY